MFNQPLYPDLLFPLSSCFLTKTLTMIIIKMNLLYQDITNQTHHLHNLKTKRRFYGWFLRKYFLVLCNHKLR